jgi:cellulose synthase operon protein C
VSSDHLFVRALLSGQLAIARCFFALVAASAPTNSAYAQDGVFGQIPAEMVQPRVARPQGETLRRLERLRWLTEQQAWDELCTVADELLAGSADGWAPVEPDRYVGVREAVHRQIAALPAEGLTAYRARADSLAEEWLEQGTESRDELLLRRVADQAFCSSAGDDALWALGEIALERGDYQAARAAWQQIRRETAGQAALAYPDSSIELADVRARLALVSIREGDFERAEQEVAELRSQHAGAVGRLGGGEANLAARLSELLDEARGWPEINNVRGGWPTLNANAARTGVAGATLAGSAEFEQAWSIDIESPRAESRLIPEAMVYPVATDGAAIIRDAGGIAAAPLESSLPANEMRRIFEAADVRLPAENWGLTIDAEKVFAVIAAADRGEAPTTRLVALDLSRDGALLLKEAPATEEALYTGPPVVDGARVVGGELSPGQGANAAVVCYDLWSRKVLWRRVLGSGFHIVAEGKPPAFEVAISLQAGMLYVNTNLGMIAAIRLEDGEPFWLHVYERRLGEQAVAEPVGLPTSKQRPHPCLVAGSRVIVAPADFDGLVALDAATGEEVWSASLSAPDAQLLAVDGNRVILSGERLWAINAATGKLDPHYGEELSGGAGQGAVAGELILWPTTGEILLVNRSSGKPTGKALSLPTGGGAHLAVAKSAKSGDIYIVAAGPSKLTAYRAVLVSTAGEDDGR